MKGVTCKAPLRKCSPSNTIPSNGIRFSISDLSPPRARLLKSVYRERAAISLFDALNSSAGGNGVSGPLVFPPETISLVSQTLARFRSIAIDGYGVPEENITVFATEAMRRAQNAASMLDAIRAETGGLNVQVLAPQVETLFGSVGARSGFVDVKGLFLDLGGGSVQMTYMDTYAAGRDAAAAGEPRGDYEIAAAEAGQSLPFGAARLIRVLETADAEVRAAEMSKLHAGMREAFENLRQRFASLADTVSKVQIKVQNGEEGAGLDIYLCGGGFRGYGSMLMHQDPIQPYPLPSIGSYTVTGALFRQTKWMSKVNEKYNAKIFGMSKRRRAQVSTEVFLVAYRMCLICDGGRSDHTMSARREVETEANKVT